MSSTDSDPALEALIADFYAAFDNRDGRVPEGPPLRALFAEGATITRVTPTAEADVWTPEAFIAPRIAMLTDGTLTGFHEWETAARTVVLRNIAQRWSTYEKSGTLTGEPYGGGGEKLIHLRRDAGAWRITAILWEDDA